MDDIFVSDEDRAAVVRQLQKHTADGRLTIDEFSERVEETYRARTSSDLRAVLRNLPPSLVEPAPRRPGPRRERHRFTVVPLAIAFMVFGLFAISGHVWFPLPILFIGWFCWPARHRHHEHRVYH